jgi:hypothetical protein
MKSVFADGLYDQHRRYSAPAVPPTTAVGATAYASYGDEDTEVVDVSPTKVLTPLASLPQASVDSKIRTTLDATKPTPES